MELEMHPNDGLKYLLKECYKDVERYKAVIVKYEKYIDERKKTIALIEAELKERGE